MSFSPRELAELSYQRHQRELAEQAATKTDDAQWDAAQAAYDAAQADYQNIPTAARRAVDELGNLLAVRAGYGEND